MADIDSSTYPVVTTPAGAFYLFGYDAGASDPGNRITDASLKVLFQSVANTAGKATQRDTDGSIDVSAINLDTAGSPTGQEGQLRWNATDKCAEVVQDGGVVVQLGQEITVRARNTTGSTLTNGTPVYVNGATGNRPTIAKADADAFSTSSTLIGLVTDTAGIANNGDGHVTVFGLVRDLDTSSFSEGATLYLSDGTAGTLTATKPTTVSSFVVRVGFVARSHATQGVILVSPQFMGSVTGDSLLSSPSKQAARSSIDVAATGASEYIMTDSFNRANTALGTLGFPDLGSEWVVLNYPGSFPMVPATNGSIVSGAFTMPEQNPPKACYASQTFAAPPRGMMLGVKWAAGTGAGNSSVVLATSTTDEFIRNMVHCVLTRTYATIEVRVDGGSFVELSRILYSSLPTDGTVALFEMEVSGNTCAIAVSHSSIGRRQVDVTDSRIGTCHGRFCFWELYHDAATVAAMPSITRAAAWPISSSKPYFLGSSNFASLFSSASSGGTYSFADNSRDTSLGLSNSGTVATFTINLPSAAKSVVGQKVGIYTSTQITAVTFASSGGTILQAPTLLRAGDYIEFTKRTDTIWQPTSITSTRFLAFITPTEGQTLSYTTFGGQDATIALAPAGALSALTVNIPSATDSRNTQRVTIVSTQNVSAVTFGSSGATFLNAPTGLTAGVGVTFEKVASTFWMRVS